MNNTTKVLGTAIENIHYTIKNINGALTNPRKRTPLTHDITTKFTPESIKKVKTTQTNGQLEASNESSSKPHKILSTGSFVELRQKRYQFKQLFGDLFIGKNPTPLATSFLVLELNFSGIRTDATYDIFEDSFHKHALTNLLRLLNAIELCGYKTVCDRGIVYVFQTGVTPVAMSEFTSGFNISTDLALNEEFWDLHGFKQSEVELLLDNALGSNLPSDIKKGIVKWLKEENDGYFFNPNQAEGIFNTAHILYCIHMLIGQIKFIRYGEDSSSIIKKFLHFPPDPNTLPSQTILELIVNNPLGKSILTEALNQSPLESRNGIEQRFCLTSICELATDRNPYYRSCFIPREFIVEVLKIYNWKEEDLIPVRSCLQILEAECDIELLCRFVEETLLKPLKDNSVKHSNEEALKQSFMDTLILTLHADIEPEFRVNSQSYNLGNKAIDLVKTSTGGRIAIEFNNIRMEYINLNGAQSTWQEATQVSRSLMTKTEDEILSLKISDPFQPNQNSVHQALEWKINKKSYEYLELLKK
ncbi:8212_t:CDS:2 [Entrophospora sp. SA101]|nr:5119_t:CDS:2 [Entrophospora sp. SA101]CAJ0826586.1 8212_t:CDS:2 [Entrophospora sp. SA101]